MSKLDNSPDGTLVHDINSTISALINALDLINDEWRSNPELVDKILPLTTQKLELLQEQLQLYRAGKN